MYVLAKGVKLEEMERSRITFWLPTRRDGPLAAADYWLRDWAQSGFDWSLLFSALSYRSGWLSRWLICAESAAAKMTSVEAIKLKTR